MGRNLICLFILLALVSCQESEIPSDMNTNSSLPANITEALLDNLSWMNEPDSYSVQDSTLRITAVKGSDFFNNPEDSSVVGTAPLLYQSINGDFIAKALIQPDFSAQWNAVALMVYIDSLHWIKFAFENSDATGPSVVSVVTKTTRMMPMVPS